MEHKFSLFYFPHTNLLPMPPTGKIYPEIKNKRAWLTSLQSSTFRSMNQGREGQGEDLEKQMENKQQRGEEGDTVRVKTLMRAEGHYKQVFVTMGTISRDWEETTSRWEREKHLSSLTFLECKADRAMHLFALSFAYLDNISFFVYYYY